MREVLHHEEMCLACRYKCQQCASQNSTKTWKQLTARNLPKQLFLYSRPPGRIILLYSRFFWQIFPTNFSKQCHHQLMCNISLTKVAGGCSFDFLISNHRLKPRHGYLRGLTLHILDFMLLAKKIDLSQLIFFKILEAFICNFRIWCRLSHLSFMQFSINSLWKD